MGAYVGRPAQKDGRVMVNWRYVDGGDVQPTDEGSEAAALGTVAFPRRPAGPRRSASGCERAAARIPAPGPGSSWPS